MLATMLGLSVVAAWAKGAATSTVRLVTERGSETYLECVVEKAEPRFIVFTSAKGKITMVPGVGQMMENAGKRITHSGDYTIVPD